MKTLRYIPILPLFLLLQSCGIYTTPPGGVDHKAYIGETTPSQKAFKKLPTPKDKVIVGVYKFRDQTGQYKESERVANWSTAIPQGLTSMLIKSLEDSKWFEPVERENLGNLLNERQIIKKTRQEYGQTDQKLSPILFAGTLLEGGVISYDTNILTGGAGVRYFGVGGSSEYRQDRITVYLRAVSTSSGKILKTVYTSKTILSQSLNASMFRYVDPDRILEAEVGVTNNEPTQIAVTEAINKAVYLLILEGLQDHLWQSTTEDSELVDQLLKDHQENIAKNNKRVSGKGIWNRKRSKLSFTGAFTLNNLRSDYKTDKWHPGFKGSLQYRFINHLGVNFSLGYQKLGANQHFKSDFINADLDLEYRVLPHHAFTPFISGGLGVISDLKDGHDNGFKFKTQFGGGLEYMFSQTIGLRLFTVYNIGFDDDWDQMVSGKRNDHFFQVGLGLQLDLGNLFK